MIISITGLKPKSFWHTLPFWYRAIPSFSQSQKVDLLRLDTLHPIVSGNKFYKLRFYIAAAIQNGCSTVVSFGGPYSNHIVALAFTAREAKLKSIGYIRTNADEPMTPSLAEAKAYGMELVYLGRTDFQTKKASILELSATKSDTYFIDEGGYGAIGAKGAATILSENNTAHYDYIICAVGTGTMLAGCINAASPNQKIIGIPVLKNEGSIENEINALLLDKNNPNYDLHNDPNYDSTNDSNNDKINPSNGSKATTDYLRLINNSFLFENIFVNKGLSFLNPRSSNKNFIKSRCPL